MKVHLNRAAFATLAATAALSVAVVFSIAPTTRADDKAEKADKLGAKECCTAEDAPEGLAKDAMAKLKALAGTWTKEKDGQTLTVTFHPVANGSAVVESMFPGTPHEMVNVYHADGNAVMVTHYCAMGVQPRMLMTTADPKTMKFNFMDSTNLKSRNDAHMDSLELTIEGDKLTENWSYFKDGKVTSNTVFELKRQPAQANAQN
jgi:hypothetical protein